MNITYFGHAAVGLTAATSPWPGFRLLIDPYEAGGFDGQINYPAIDNRFDPDLIAVTHEHIDHNYTAAWSDRPVLRPQRPAPKDIPLEVCWLDCAHDAFDGTTRGGRTGVLRVVVDGVAIVHTGDLGELPPPHVLAALKPCDILLIGCGGYFTLGPSEACELSLRLGARTTIPIHFASEHCDLPQLGNTEGMLARLPVSQRCTGSWQYPLGGPTAGLVLISPDES